MNAAVDHPRAAGASLAADLIAAQGVGGVNPDSHHIAARYGREIKGLECFVDQARIAILGGGGGRKDVEPAGRDDGDTERNIARIYEMNAHALQYATSEPILFRNLFGRSPGACVRAPLSFQEIPCESLP